MTYICRKCIHLSFETNRCRKKDSQFHKQTRDDNAPACPYFVFGAPSERKGGWSQTYTGRAIYPLDPRPEDLDIRDIAHALSLQCRFAGHTRFPYSVAQHSLMVRELVHWYGDAADLAAEDMPSDDEWGAMELTALMHDAAEAYLIDVPRPLKQHLPGYKDAEEAWVAALAVRYSLVHPMPKLIKWADNAALAIERDALFGVQTMPWDPLPTPPFALAVIERKRPEDVEVQFLRDFYALMMELPEGRP
jgi:hypothetical protein